MKVLLIDDHAVLREGLKSLLFSWNENIEIFEAGNANEAQSLSQSISGLNLILLDLNLPGVEGYELLEALMAQDKSIPLAVFSVTEKPSVIKDVLQRGARGYIPKSASPEVMKSAINIILSGSIYIPPSLLDLTGEIPSQGKSDEVVTVHGNDTTRSLTARQMEIVELLIQGKTNKEIGVTLHMSAATVRSHLTVIFRQLNVKNRTEAVHVIQNAGLLTSGVI